MSNLLDTPGTLEALRDDIYPEKILRARNMTVEQRLAEVLELSNAAMAQMHEQAMRQLGLNNPEEGWKVVSQSLDRLQKVSDEG